MDNEKGSVKNIHYGDILTKYNDTLRDISVVPFVNKNIDLSRFGEESYLKNGDIVIADTAEDFTAGKAVEVLNIDFPILAGQHTFLCRPKINFAPGFMGYYLNSPSYHNRLILLLTGTKVYSISKANIKNTFILYPENYEEQQKIADCLSSIDELIDAETRKLTALEKYKKGLTLPEWRFPEFQDHDAWIKIMLGDISDVLMCKRIFANETSEIGDVPFYKIGTLGGKADSFISRALFEKYKKTYRFPRQGEILISCSGTIGRCLPYDGEDAYYQDSNIVWIDNPTLLISNELLLYLLSNVHWNKLNSTTITRIYTSDLKKLILTFPENKDEQQKIADCLSAIDTMITEQSNKVEQLKTHKKGLVQNNLRI